jgi:hypothetical protein
MVGREKVTQKRDQTFQAGFKKLVFKLIRYDHNPLNSR